MAYFPISQGALEHLSQADPALAALIASRQPPRRELRTDLFTALLHSMTGQQISGRAQAAIWGRLLERYGSPPGSDLLLPTEIAAAEECGLRACGVSLSKAQRMRQVAAAFASGQLEATTLAALEDEEAIARLTALPGVGRWTAEMLLLFALARPDILSYGDFGIRRGLLLLHQLPGDKLSQADFQAYRALYSPFGSTASLYLWEVQR